MRILSVILLMLWKATPSCAGAYTYHSVYDYGLSTDQLSWIVVGSLIAFGIFLVVVIFVCRQCGFCAYPHDTRLSSTAAVDTRPFHIDVAVIDTQAIGGFQQVHHQSPDEGVSPKLPGLPPYVPEYVQNDSIKSAPPPYTVEAQPW
ncbi:uncharacterized protein LOC132556495 [Ylistrum balloti]|uniref:uncharacterized protein LOC132556495 n=1 Tax=Ylistrum balloti TaxID=509963 RepID=UPI002905AEAB|nr:uncharacterized protein LOC132556495 [Ylistrum balloti]